VKKTSTVNERFGRYQIQAELGRGGMGIVYRAYEETLHRTVALKVLSPHLAGRAGTVARLRHEAVSAARLRHPNIALLYELGQEDQQAFLAMEYVPGCPLRDIIESGPLLYSRSIHLLRQIGRALDYAHSIGVVHRDVKPGNILVRPDDHAMLVDFGLAETADNTLATPDGVVLGTPHYMSPEQAAGREAGPASDQYSLAAVAYEMLTGVLPFHFQNTAAVVHAHIYELPPPPTENNPALPVAVNHVLLKALSKRPSDRYLSLSDFVDDLERVLLPPPDVPVRRRRALQWTLVGMLVLLVVAFIALSGPAAHLLNRDNVNQTDLPGKVLWSYAPGFVGGPELTAVQESLVVKNPGGQLTVLRASDGKIVWATKAGLLASYGAPSANSELVFVGSQPGRVEGLSLTTGGTVWSTEVTGNVESPPVLYPNGLVAVTTKGYIYVLQPGSGLVIWSRPFVIGIQTPTIAPDHLLVSAGSTLYALDLENGRMLWEFHAGSRITTRPVVIDNRVVVGTDQGILHVLTAADGVELWRYQAPGTLMAAPTAGDRILYVPDQSGRIAAISMDRMTVLWDYQAGASLETTPLLYGDHLIFGSSSGKLFMLNARDGGLEQMIQFSASITSAPVQASGKIFVRADRVYAFSP
jgi:outer membrane protein assembly factor BamB